MSGEEEVIVLRAADLIPERERCARSDDDQDTRYCRECLQKPCRWFSGWRPSPPRVAPPQLCACGMKHYPGEPGFTPKDCSGWRAPEEVVPEAVAREMDTACNSVTEGKTEEHFKSRKALFHAVDSQIRARVKTVLPDVVLEFKQQIDADLGLDALRRRVRTVSENVAKEADRIERSMEARLRERLEEMFTRLEQETADHIVAMLTNRAGAIVAKEVGRQLARLLAPKRATKKKRAKKKSKRAP